jgi:hypothetical protein
MHETNHARDGPLMVRAHRSHRPASPHFPPALQGGNQPMQTTRRRLSPSIILSSVAVFVALAGTAVADVIITSPDQLGNNVVTGRSIGSNEIVSSDVRQESLVDNDLADPQLKVRAIGSGAILPGSDGTVQRLSKGTYRVTFNAFALNANGNTTTDTMLNNNCAFSAVSRNKLAIMSVDGPFAVSPNSVTVQAAFPGTNGLLSAVDTQFDLLASC